MSERAQINGADYDRWLSDEPGLLHVKPSYRDPRDYAIWDDTGCVLGEAFDDTHPETLRDAKANAQLWAASPAMRDLLRRQVQAMAEMPTSDLNYSGMAWKRDAERVLKAIEEG